MEAKEQAAETWVLGPGRSVSVHGSYRITAVVRGGKPCVTLSPIPAIQYKKNSVSGEPETTMDGQ